jgi:hypothetical protein
MVRLRNWRSVTLTIAGVWIMGPAEIGVDMLVAVTLLGSEPGRIAGAEAGALARALMYSAIWTACLLRSKRVANTYRRHTDTGELETVFS